MPFLGPRMVQLEGAVVRILRERQARTPGTGGLVRAPEVGDAVVAALANAA